jgi:hypothetical protein
MFRERAKLCVLLVPLWIGASQAPTDKTPGAWQDAVTYRLPDDVLTKRRVARAAEWLTRHVVSVLRTQEERPLHVIAWKDPTLEPADPKLLAGYLITDTLWSSKALRLFDPVAAQNLEESTQRVSWYGNGLHDILFHRLDKILHCPADRDFVHGMSLGRFPIPDGRVVDLRVFRQKWDARFEVGHPRLFAEHAVYQALYDYWQGREDAARHRLRRIMEEHRTADRTDRVFWDRQFGILVDHVNHEEWRAFGEGERAVCRHYTFKLGVLLYAIRLMGMENECRTALGGMTQRLWSAQRESGGLAHFVDVQHDKTTTPGLEPTGEASAIGILCEVVVPGRGR